MSKNESSVWIMCRECGHTSRSLAVMAKRILQERRSCPDCHSKNAPILEPTPSGANMSLLHWRFAMTDWEASAIRPDFDTVHGDDIRTTASKSWASRAIRHFSSLTLHWLHRP